MNSYKQFIVDFDSGNLLDNDGAILMTTPSISYQACPSWELHFMQTSTDNTLVPVDISEAVSWTSAIDQDFSDTTEPMVRVLPSSIITSGAASGIIIVPLDANTTTFYEKINGRQSLPCWVEFRGRDSNDKIVFDYKFRVNALGAIDATEGTPLNPPSGSVTLADVYALLRSSLEFRFSADGTNWHTTQQTGDIYYESRYPEGEWSEPIEIVKGTDGADGYNVKFEYSADKSSWHTTPVSSDFYFRNSNDNGSTWTTGILFRGSDGENGIGFELLGEYNAETTYNPASLGNYECVYYDGSTYAYINSSASSGHMPPATSDEYWMKIAAKGSVDNITVADITDFNSTMSGLLSGYALKGEVYTTAQVNNLLAEKANANDVYTTEEADNKFVDLDELSQATSNLVTLTQWNTQNATFQGEIDYLSGVISGGGGGGDLSNYTPLSTTQTVSGYLQNEINNISGNIPSSSIEGVNLNNERTLQVSNIAWVLAMPMRTVMPDANETDQDFMFYVGNNITISGTQYIKAHLYEKVLDPDAPPPSDDDIYISIPEYGIDNVKLTKVTAGVWTSGQDYQGTITIQSGQGSQCEENAWTISIDSDPYKYLIGPSGSATGGALPWEVTAWLKDMARTYVDVFMTHYPHGGGSSRYHWEDISPWASNS